MLEHAAGLTQGRCLNPSPSPTPLPLPLPIPIPGRNPALGATLAVTLAVVSLALAHVRWSVYHTSWLNQRNKRTGRRAPSLVLLQHLHD